MNIIRIILPALAFAMLGAAFVTPKPGPSPFKLPGPVQEARSLH